MTLPSSSVGELSQQGTNRDFQVAIINFLIRNIVRAIGYFKLQIDYPKSWSVYMYK